MVMVPAVIMGVVGCKISCLTFFFPPGIKDSNSAVSFFSPLFFLGRSGGSMNSLSPFYIHRFLSFEYCIAFSRIISFSLNLKSLIITAQQDSSANGPGPRDLYALSISKASISSQSKTAFNFPFFLFLFNKMMSVKVSSRNFSHHLFCQIHVDNLHDCGIPTACSPLEIL